MKLSDMEEAGRLARHLVHQKELYKKLKEGLVEFSIAINNQRQTPMFLPKLKSDLLRYMLEEIDEMEAKLVAFGVEVD